MTQRDRKMDSKTSNKFISYVGLEQHEMQVCMRRPLRLRFYANSLLIE